MFIFGVCFVLHLIKLSAEKDIVYKFTQVTFRATVCSVM